MKQDFSKISDQKLKALLKLWKIMDKVLIFLVVAGVLCVVWGMFLGTIQASQIATILLVPIVMKIFYSKPLIDSYEAEMQRRKLK